MAYSKPQLSDDEIRALLSERFAAPERELRVLEGGQVAQTVAFSANGQSYVLHINPPKSITFGKDVYVYRHYATPDLPIPPIYQVGMLGELPYKISMMMPGRPMIDMSDEEIEGYVPLLIETLDRIHASGVSDSSGYGGFDERGIAPYRSWREFIASVSDEHEPGTFFGKWHTMFDETFLERDLWDRIYAAMVRLLDYCPEGRWLLHADYAFGNVLVQDGRITAVLDWANALYGDYLFDVEWLNYVLPNHQILDRFTAYYAAQGRTVPHFDERIRCYRYLIILDSMRFWALVGKEEEYIAMREKILPTLW